MKRFKIKEYKIILIAFLLGLIGLFFIKIFTGFTQNIKASAENLPSIFSISSEDSNLFSSQYKTRLKVIEVFKSRVRNSISIMTIDTIYNVIMYQIDLAKDESLKEIINIEYKSMDRSTGITYNILDNNDFKFEYKSGIVNPVSKIYLTLKADSLKVIQNSDSIIKYYCMCQNLSLSYGKTEPIDIFMVGKTQVLDIVKSSPIELIFIKSKMKIFLLLLTCNDHNKPFPINLLNSISHLTQE